MEEAVASPPPRRNFILLVVGEFVALGLAAAAMIRFDLGWLGAILIATVVAVFTIAIVRPPKARAESARIARELRYNRRMLCQGCT